MKQVNEVTTELQFENAVNKCREIFLKKTKDYGTSWRVYRTISVADRFILRPKE